MKIILKYSFALLIITKLVYSGTSVNIALAIDEIEKFQTYELSFKSEKIPPNPFDTYLLKLKITDPTGKQFIIDGFFDGDGEGGQTGNIWKARICPFRSGLWKWITVNGDIEDKALMDLKGQFICKDNQYTGGIIANGQFFQFQNGNYIFLQGNFLDFAGKRVSTHVLMSEQLSKEQRLELLERQKYFHSVNKINVYLANKGDYGGKSVTPWLGTSEFNDKSMFDIGRWQNYDHYIQQIKELGMICELWFFADDSGFEQIKADDRNRLFRYAMARTSAFNHTMYVIALEWNEKWEKFDIEASGKYLQSKNPWGRLVSVHSLPHFNYDEKWWKRFLKRVYAKIKGSNWPFSGKNWANFIASQAGNNTTPKDVNELAIIMREKESIPHISEEFGILKVDSDRKLRANMWANLCGGAAGGGTGSDLKAFMSFIEESKIPFYRMVPSNKLVKGGGTSHFCLAENDHHYIVYSQKGSIDLRIQGENLKGYWFNPRDPESKLGNSFLVQPGKNTFIPPKDLSKDWILWITDQTNLRQSSIYPSKEAFIKK